VIVFSALNRTLRRQRRHMAMLVVMLGLAGAVVVAHSAVGHGDMGESVLMCLAVAETAVVVVGAALVFNARIRRPLWLLPAPLEPALWMDPAPPGVRTRAGPPLLQVFRL
jgi:hypothetical protein